MKKNSVQKHAQGFGDFGIRNSEFEFRNSKILLTLSDLSAPGLQSFREADSAVQSVFLAGAQRFFSAFRLPLSAFEPTRYALVSVFFLTGIFNLSAQRLDITDVNSKSPNEPGFDLRLALGGTVNSDMTVSTRDGRSYPRALS